eukprot:scaffold54422_cov19-Tisochrysis_lutea.AAC.2
MTKGEQWQRIARGNNDKELSGLEGRDKVEMAAGVPVRGMCSAVYAQLCVLTLIPHSVLKLEGGAKLATLVSARKKVKDLKSGHNGN